LFAAAKYDVAISTACGALEWIVVLNYYVERMLDWLLV
jgi:hypothetical protein